MKPYLALRVILTLSLVLIVAAELPTFAEEPFQTRPLFKTHFQDESQFIVETIISDLAEEIFYARHGRLPDAQQYSVVSLQKRGLGPRFAYEAQKERPIYDITITFETNRPSVQAELEVNGPIWSPEIYAGLGAMLVKDVGLSIGDPRGQSDLGLLSALVDSKAVTIENENQKLSKALEREFTNPFLHEQAAVLLGAFALRDHADYFSDVRLPLCRMTTHLIMARLLSGQKPPGMTGRMADAMLFTLMNNEVSALEKLDSLDKNNPVMVNWIRTLRAYNTKDYRQITNSAAASPIENIARFNAFARSVNLDVAWNKLAKDDKLVPDFLRIAEAAGYSVETGHQLLRISLPLELQEITTIYEKHQARQLAPPDLVRELNVIPERCFTTDTNGAVGIGVIGWGQWASFFQRHLCLALAEGFDFMDRMWGVHDEAASYAAACNKRFGGLRLYPFVRRYHCTDAAAYPTIVEDGIRICAATPNLVPIECWEKLRTPVPGAKSRNMIGLWDWLETGFPPGTAFEGGQYTRQSEFDPEQTKRLKVHEMAPYDRAISHSIYWRDYNQNPTYQQAEALYRPVLSYATYAMVRVANTVKDQPDRYVELMAKASELNPSLYVTLGEYCAEHRLDDKAEEYYLKGDELGPDSVAMASVASWRVKYYLKKSLKDKARRVADEAGEVYSHCGLQAKAEFLEAIGHYSEAFDWYSKIEERYGDSSCLVEFCARYKAKTGENRFEDEYNKRIKSVFPNGFESVTLKDFGSAPKDGVLLKENSELLRKAGLKAGDIIVGLNGIRVHNVAQYNFKREASPAPEMVLIVWQGRGYNEIHASPPNHRFGVDICDYEK